MSNILKRIGFGIASVRLGDAVSNALSKVGVTEDRVKEWLGKECGCRRRREKLNRLTQWVGKVMVGGDPEAVKELEEMMKQP